MGELVFQFSTCLPAPDDWAARHIPLLFDPSWQIRHILHSPFSHVDIVLKEGLLGASDSPDAPILGGNGRGVAIRPHNYQRFGIRRRARIQTVTADAVIDYAMLQLHKPFDHEAVSLKHFFSDKLRTNDWRDDGQWFCAELCARASEVGGLFKWPLVVIKALVTPPDFLLMINPLMSNASTFWEPVEGLKLMDGEL